MAPLRSRIGFLVRPAVAFALGAAVPWGCDRALFAAGEPWRPGPPSVWVADRDAGRLVALDRELYVCAAATLIAPIAVGAVGAVGAVDVGGSGGAWALDLVERRPGGALRLARVDADGRLRAEHTLVPAGAPPREAPPDLCVDAGGGASVCVPETAGGVAASVACYRGDGTQVARLAVPRARAVARCGRRMLVGGADGVLREFELDDARGRAPPDLGAPGGGATLVGLGDAGAAVLDVAPAGGTAWWVLTAGVRASARRILLVGGFELSAAWSAGVELDADTLAAVPAEAGEDPSAWLVSRTRAAVRRVDAFRPIEPGDEIAGLPLGGFGAAAARADGGLLLPAPGAVLWLAPDGRLVRSQGGFDCLVAAACVP